MSSMLSHLRLITLHGVSSKSLKLGRQSQMKEADKDIQKVKVYLNGRIQKHSRIVNQPAIQAATTLMAVLRDMDVGP